MSKRKIIHIDEQKCNGCGLCLPNCPEGAIQMIDGKARLISDLFCDGLGACIGHCPQGAIAIEEREAGEYDEKKVMAAIVKQGKKVIKAHLKHLADHNQKEYLKEAISFLEENKIPVPSEEDRAHAHISPSGCPGSRIAEFGKIQSPAGKDRSVPRASSESQLRQWPVQLMLVPAHAPFLNNADILIAADCVPFAYADFHAELLQGKVLLVGCPKLDDVSLYQEKISEMVENTSVKSITYAHMEVPCCSGLVSVIRQAIAASGKEIPFKEAVISIQGERLP